MPCDGVADTKVRPAGSRSANVTFVAVDGPLLLTVTVKVTVLPTPGVALSTVFVIARSACCGVTAALAELFATFGSDWSACVIAAVLVCAAGDTTVAESARLAEPRLAIEPTVHTPVAGTYVPCYGVAETNVRPAGKMSVAVTFVAAVGPLLVTITVKVTVSPTFGAGLSTDLATARSDG